MIKLNILDLNDFLHVVNECEGAVNLLYPGGKRENINKEYVAQNELRRTFKENKNYMRLSLDIPSPNDYMSIVFHHIRNC